MPGPRATPQSMSEHTALASFTLLLKQLYSEELPLHTASPYITTLWISPVCDVTDPKVEKPV